MSDFRIGETVVYPSHGVGTISAIEVQKIQDIPISMLVIVFDQDKMAVKVPSHKAAKVGLRHVVSANAMNKAIDILRTKQKIERGMWSKRAMEYEAKINSGNVNLVAEVVRDLYREPNMNERSYNERLLYEAAVHRLCSEYAAIHSVDLTSSMQLVLDILKAKHSHSDTTDL